MTGEMSHCGLDKDDSCFDGGETTIIATHSLIVYYVYKSLKQS